MSKHHIQEHTDKHIIHINSCPIFPKDHNSLMIISSCFAQLITRKSQNTEPCHG